MNTTERARLRRFAPLLDRPRPVENGSTLRALISAELERDMRLLWALELPIPAKPYLQTPPKDQR